MLGPGPRGLTIGYSYTVVVYSVDKYGNVTSPVRHSVVVRG
jgi:hypothetical protein